jgi:hypothetical protein
MGSSAIEPPFFCSGGTMFSTARVQKVVPSVAAPGMIWGENAENNDAKLQQTGISHCCWQRAAVMCASLLLLLLQHAGSKVAFDQKRDLLF